MQDAAVSTVQSADGTAIAYVVTGRGPALVITVGAFNDRRTAAGLAAALSGQFTVYSYDRRGRGDSGDNPRYAVQREVEDLDAVLRAAGGTAALFGFSSGAALALKAASALEVDKLVLFGPPIITDASRPPLPGDLADRVKLLADRGARGEAVELFQREAIGMPQPVVEKMRQAPFRPALEAMAHTLFYDLSIIAAATDYEPMLGALGMPALVLSGSEAPPWITASARKLASALPQGSFASVEGVGQELDAARIAPLARDFLDR